jgi:hypothetical protein
MITISLNDYIPKAGKVNSLRKREEVGITSTDKMRVICGQTFLTE